MTTQTDTSTARTADIAATWLEYPARLVTVSSGIVHVATDRGFTLCGTRAAVRTATEGIAPTCRMCGAA